MALQNVKDLFMFLENNRQSPTISVAYGSITDEGASKLAEFVRENPFVKYLDVRGNMLTAAGVTALANGIKINRSMRSLNLKWNCIGKGDTGTEHLCEALKGNLTIHNVDLRNNQISMQGAKYIAEMIKVNTTITHMDLSWNDFDKEGGLAILESLKRNNTLLQLELNGCRCGEEVLHEVAFLLRRNQAAAKAKADDEKERAGPEEIPEEEEGRGHVRGKTRTAQDDRSLMLRLMMRERECKMPDEKVFYRELAAHIQKLLKDADLHKDGRSAGEGRESLAATGFTDREDKYLMDVKASEDNLRLAVKDKADLKIEVHRQIHDLKELNSESAEAVREVMRSQEHALAEEQLLKSELRDIVNDKRELTDKLALLSKDLELLDEESGRLQDCVDTFNRDIQTILYDDGDVPAG
jgi:Ran GTPase-activating protein (RanGAP) involved in mRNA processing and transport